MKKATPNKSSEQFYS